MARALITLVLLASVALAAAPAPAWAQGKPRIARPTASSGPTPARVRRFYGRAHTARRDRRLRVRDHDQGDAISDRAYEHLRDAAKELLTTFPPDRHFYLGVGRSPSGLVELLQAVLPHQAQGFPASGLSDRAGHAITPQERASYDRHLDHFLPRPERLAGRTILLMDIVASGGTLRKLKPIVESYLERRGIRARVETLALDGGAAGTDHALSKRYDMKIAGSEEIARYGQHVIGRRDVGELQPNPRRESFVRSLVRKLAQDQAFDSFIGAGFRTPITLRHEPHPMELHPRREMEAPAGSPQRALGRLREEIGQAFAGRPFERDGQRLANGTVTLRFDLTSKGDGSPRWVVRSALGASSSAPGLSQFQPTLDQASRIPQRPDRHGPLEVTLRLDSEGVLRGPDAVSVERGNEQVPLGSAADWVVGVKRIPNVSESAARRPRKDPTSAQRAVARALSDLAFRSEDGSRATSLTLELKPSTRRQGHDANAWSVRTSLPPSVSKRVLDDVDDKLEPLTRNSHAPRRPYGLAIRVRLDERGEVSSADAVTIERVPLRTILSPTEKGSGVAYLTHGDRPREAPVPKGTLEKAIFKALSRTQLVEDDGGPARKVAIELQPRDRAVFDATSRMPPSLVSDALDSQGLLLERFSRHPHWDRRYGIHIELRLDAEGRLRSARDVSVERKPEVIEVGRDKGGQLVAAYARRGTVDKRAVRSDIARAFSGLSFRAGEEVPEQLVISLTPTFTRSSNMLAWTSESRLPPRLVESVLEPRGERLGLLARAPDDHTSFEGLRITLRPRPDGTVRSAKDVSIERVTPEVGLRPLMFRTTFQQGRRDPGTVDPPKDRAAVRELIARHFAHRSFREPGRTQAARSVRFELHPDGPAWAVHSRVPTESYRSLLRLDPALFERLATAPGVAITLRLDENGELKGASNVTVRALEE